MKKAEQTLDITFHNPYGVDKLIKELVRISAEIMSEITRQRLLHIENN